MAEISSNIDLSWVQCNKCMKKMIKYEGLRYGLTNCGHIYCENCLKNATQPKCFVCQAPSPRAIELNQHLRPELRRQFLAVVPVSQAMRVAIKYRDHHDSINNQRFKKGLAAMGLQFRNAKEKIDELKNAVTNGNQRIQVARSKNMKLKEYGMKLTQEKKNLEFQIQQKKATSTSFQNAAFKAVKSPPVTRKRLNVNSPSNMGPGDGQANNFSGQTSHFGGQTNNFALNNGFNLDSSQTFQGPSFFNKSSFETPMVRKFNF